MVMLALLVARAEPQWPAPAPGVSTALPASPAPTGLLEVAYRRYRGRSQADGPRCSYYPTCSAYGIQAVRQRGAVLGMLLSMDRLLREYPGMARHDHYPITIPHQTPRFDDPVPARRRAR